MAGWAEGTERKAGSPTPGPFSSIRVPLLPLPLPSPGGRGMWKEINFDPQILAPGPKLGWKAEVSRTLSAPLPAPSPSAPNPAAAAPLLSTPLPPSAFRAPLSDPADTAKVHPGGAGAVVEGEGWGRREGRREPDRSHPQLQPLAGRDCLGSRRRRRRRKARSSGGRAPKPRRVGPQAGWTQAQAGARRRGEGAWFRRRGRGTPVTLSAPSIQGRAGQSCSCPGATLRRRNGSWCRPSRSPGCSGRGCKCSASSGSS